MQRAAWVLRWRDEPREPARILELISSPSNLAAAIRGSMPKGDAMAERWLVELDAPTNTVREAFQSFSERLGTLLDSPAGRSLGAGSASLRLADVMATSAKLLIQLDPRYGALARKIGAWTLVAMLRLAAELRQAKWSGKCLFLIDEPRLLEHEGRHLANLFGTARDAGLGVVVADWGIAGLRAVDPDLPDAIMRSTAWQVVLRQGSAADAEQIAAQFGRVWREDVSRSNDGRTTSRLRQEPRVYASSLLQLPTAHGWLRVAPIGMTARERVEHVVFAVPAQPKFPKRLALPPALDEPSDEPQSEPGEPRGSVGGSPSGEKTEFEVDNGASRDESLNRAVRAGTLRNAEPDLSTPEGQRRAVYRRVRTIGGWRRWRGLFDYDGWPTMWSLRPYKLIYEWERGPIPPEWTIDHTCGEKDCLDHLEAVTRGENLRRRHARERGELPIGHAGLTLGTQGPADMESEVEPGEAAQDSQELNVEARRAEVRRLRAQGWSVRRIAAQLHVGYGTVRRDAAEAAAEKPAAATSFAIALFERYDRPTVVQRSVDLEQLARMLTTFRELGDKRRARCWSPTRYVDGMTSRANTGVAEVSALVFDCDRVAPDPERLKGVCWISHTTWSHTPEAPRWRVVMPLAAPVPAAQWTNLWRRARAALCPEADPSCNDPSRQYYLPSHASGAAHETTRHDGPLLDPRTLPELAPEPSRRRGATRRQFAQHPSQELHSRGEAYMARVIDNLSCMAPNTGRNVALNKAASALGEWVAAGVLEQSEVEDALYAAAEQNGLVADDGQRQCWATIRSGFRHGLERPFDLDNGHA